MNTYNDNITASLEISRNCLRRIARNDDTEFSPQSIMNLMDKFVKTVNTMDETILVPCRLMDMKVGDENDPILSNKKPNNDKRMKIFNSVDLFQIYNMLHNIKADLLYGQGQLIEDVNSGNNTTTTTTTLSANNVVKGHVRRPSTVSVTSTNSSTSTISDSESDAGNENDSGIEESPQDGCCNNTNTNINRTEQVADNFRRHLIGLQRSLKQMTETAQYLTARYQHDIGGSV